MLCLFYLPELIVYAFDTGFKLELFQCITFLIQFHDSCRMTANGKQVTACRELGGCKQLFFSGFYFVVPNHFLRRSDKSCS